MVCGIPDRNSKDRGTEARNGLVACAACSCSIGKGELHVGNLLETFQSRLSVILCLLPQWPFNLVGLSWTIVFLPGEGFHRLQDVYTTYSLLPGLPLAHCNWGRLFATTPLSWLDTRYRFRLLRTVFRCPGFQTTNSKDCFLGSIALLRDQKYHQVEKPPF